MESNFFDEIHDFQRFISQNIYLLGNYTILSEQLVLENNENGIVDLIAIDNNENRLVIIELKNTKTNDKVIWQPLRYYDLIKRSEDSFKNFINTSFTKTKKTENIDLNPKIIIVVPSCTKQLLRSLSYLENIDFVVLEIKKEKKENMVNFTKKTFYPCSLVHKEDLTNIKGKKHHQINIDTYGMFGINKEKIHLAKQMIQLTQDIFKQKNYHFDIFYKESRITVMKNQKVFMTINIKQNPISSNLYFSFKTEIQPNKSDFTYMAGTEKYKYENEKIHLVISHNICKDVFRKYV